MPRLSLCMIVRNEAAFLEELLSEARPYVDEIVVLDTGSTDRTVDIAKEGGARVEKFSWIGDFAAARNASLSYATGDWILVLDADERLTPAHWQMLRTAIADTDTSVFQLCQINYSRERALLGFKPNHFGVAGFESYPGYVESWLTRLFKNHAGYLFQGVVHEHITLAGKIVEPPRLDVCLHHHGQALSPEKMAEKKRHYLDLGFEKVKRDPSRFENRHELGIALWEAGQLRQALEQLAEADRICPDSVRNAVAYATVLKICGEYALSEAKFRHIIRVRPSELTVRAGLGGCLAAQEHFAEAIECLKDEIRLNPGFQTARLWLHDCYNKLRLQQPALKPTISVCYIVKNEQDCLGKSLANVRPHVDEIIVLDTGSTDNTVRVAEEQGAKVCRSEWRDDFAWARNESLKQATSEWILVLDADEVLGESDWCELKALVAAPKTAMYTLVQTTYTDKSTVLGWHANDISAPEAQGYPGYFESPLVRLFRNTPAIYFVGAVHENAVSEGGKHQAHAASIRIHHYGKFRDEDRMRHKNDLYHRIGLKKLGEMPDDSHAHYEMAIQMAELRMAPAEIEAFFRRALELNPNHANAVFGYAGFLFERGRLADALDQYIRLISLRPQDAQTYIYTSSLLIELKKYDLAWSMIATAKQLGDGNNIALLLNEGVIHLHFDRRIEAETAFNLALAVNERFAPAHINLGLCRLKDKDFAGARKAFERAIALDAESVLGWQKLGEVLFQTSQREESLKAFERAHALVPDDADVLSQVIINGHCLGRQDLVLAYEDKLLQVALKGNVAAAIRRVMGVYQQRHDEVGIKRLSQRLSATVGVG